MFSNSYFRAQRSRNGSLSLCSLLFLSSFLNPVLAHDPKELAVVQKIHAKVSAHQENSTPESYEVGIEETRVKLTMLPIPAGEVLMQGDADAFTAQIDAFWMCETETPWDYYNVFMAPEHIRGKEGYPKEPTSVTEEDFIMAQPSPPYHAMSFGMGVRRHPAIAMTQHGANKFCQWLSWKTGHFYRLPTEAEWEYAARAGVTTKFPWGEDLDPAAAELIAWHQDNSNGSYQRLGKKEPNKWGLKDMHGNVMEWTLDQYVPNRRETLGGAETYKNPWIKAIKPYPHVCKGGHWSGGLDLLAYGSSEKSTPIWKSSDPQTPKSIWYHTNIMWIGFRPIRPSKVPTVEEMYAYWNSGVE